MKTFFRILIIFVLSLNLSYAKGNNNELKKMSVFISNFTEFGLFEFNTSKIDLEQLTLFGIMHNRHNNYESRMSNTSCPKMTHYDAIEEKFVKESIEKYFSYKLTSALEKSKNYDYLYRDNCYYFPQADGEMRPYAKVINYKKENNFIFMYGYYYYPDMDNEIGGVFVAKTKEKSWQGKKTWELQSIKYLGDINFD